jgi:hypothetical protein
MNGAEEKNRMQIEHNESEGSFFSKNIAAHAQDNNRIKYKNTPGLSFFNCFTSLIAILHHFFHFYRFLFLLLPQPKQK